jgi:probable phosphoglycerate mutase
VSSLHCPARVHLARHGEATYETGPVSDGDGQLTAAGRAQARRLAEALRGERIARVWTSPLARAVQTAEIVAGQLGVDVVVRQGLREYGVSAHVGGEPEESGDVEARMQGVLQEAADEHSGEAVLVVSHAGAILAAVPPLVGLPVGWAPGLMLGGCGVVELEADGEAWQLIRWDARTYAG